MGPELNDRLPRQAWIAAARLTAVVIGCATLVSLVVSTIILGVLSDGIDAVGIFVSILMPTIIGTPVMFYLAVGRQRLKHANAQLAKLASTDWLTDCLNRRAFAREVEKRLGVPDAAVPCRGALLIIDADHFKTVNDRFGHDRGDEALQLIARAIKGAVREDDLVSRMGGEEFGVFLAAADAATAANVAESICAAIVAQAFAPGGKIHPPSASIGGATFTGQASLSDLFQLADAQLYEVKRVQRGRASLVAAPSAALSSAA
jgi:diguanylate cyclase (GGDEF)-like protein